MGYQKFGSNPTLRKSGLLPSNPVRACSSISFLDAQFAAMSRDTFRSSDILASRWKTDPNAVLDCDYPARATQVGAGIPRTRGRRSRVRPRRRAPLIGPRFAKPRIYAFESCCCAIGAGG